ncbi:MAG: hypothetical protein ACO3QA_09615, partial [Phycisphaerales bacterium]
MPPVFGAVVCTCVPYFVVSLDGRIRGPFRARDIRAMAFRGEVLPDDWIRLDDQPKLHLASTIKDLRFPPDLDGGGSKVPARTDDREVPNPMLPEDRGEALDVGGDETVVDPEDARPEVLDAEARIALFEDERSPRNSVVETAPTPPPPPPPAARTAPPPPPPPPPAA